MSLYRLLDQIVHGLIVMMIFGLGAISIAGLALAKLDGAHLLSIQTGSMVPLFRPGDAVLSVKSKAHSLHAGDIISYTDPTQPRLIITHRLVRIDPSSGRVTTKGDHNAKPDTPFPRQLVTGRVVAVAPHFGTVLDAARKPAGLILLVYVPALLTLMFEIRQYISQSQSHYYKLHQ
jgi:signal peptidase I